MTIPLDLLEQETINMYEITVASIRRSYQITMAGDDELEQSNGKVVSTAIKQILSRKVSYQIEG